MADIFHVNPNLMGTAGLKAYKGEGNVIFRVKALIVSNRFLTLLKVYLAHENRVGSSANGSADHS